MRRVGYQVVDMLVEHMANVREKPVTRNKDRATLARMLHEPPPSDGQDPDTILRTLRDSVFTNVMHLDHPRFFAFAPGPSNFVSVMGDALASGFNVFAGVFREGSAAAQIELTVLDWLRELCGFPDSAGGVLVSGGSVANLTALAAARKTALGDDWRAGVLYSSDQTHSSIGRAVGILGFQQNQLRQIPSDDGLCLPVKALRRAVQQDRAAGFRPFCVIANAGTINTAAIDPLLEIAELCKREQLWFHVDGAYGAAAVLTAEGRKALTGLERADSLTLDPHKWLFQPYEIGCVLLRDQHLLEQTFQVLPEYLKAILGSTDGINFCDYGLQLTRSFRALKLRMSIKAFGLDAFRSAIEIGLANARFAERRLRESEEWEIVTEANLGVLTFRYHPSGISETEVNRINLAISEQINSDGFAMIMTTEVGGKTVLRICTINPRTTEQDIAETIRWLEHHGTEAVTTATNGR